jgi:alpha-glucosidase
MTEWWRGATIYQIYPRSYQDSTGNGIGDLRGITDRLAHVASLGVDGIWLSPFFPSPMADMGYDVSDYTGVDPLFGSLEDFDNLLVHAHELGLKVIIDQVLSHTSDKHPWFVESRRSQDNDKSDWFVWADPKADGTAPNNWLSVFGGPAWEFEPRRKQYYLHNFLSKQPDLNFHNPKVQTAILETVRFWLERGVDGFRLDTVNFYVHDKSLRDNPPLPAEHMEMVVGTYAMQDHIHSKTQPENIDFLRNLRALTDEYPDRMLVGEVGEGHRAVAVMADYTRGGDRLHMAYSFELLGPKYSPKHFRNVIREFQLGAPDGWPSWSFSNHDVNRHVTRWSDHAASDETIAKQAIALLSSFPGTLGIYQGEELGLTETELVYEELTDPPGLRFWPEEKGRDGCRTPMVWERDKPNAGFSTAKPWLPVKSPQADRAVDVQETNPDSVLNAYRAQIAFRQSRPELLGGGTHFLDLSDPVLGLERSVEDQRLTCVFNLSPTPQTLNVHGKVTLVGPSQNASLTSTNLTLGPNGFAFLESDGDLHLSN